MILKLSAIPLASIAILCGNMPVPAAAIQPIAGIPTIELRPDRVHDHATVLPASFHRAPSAIHLDPNRQTGALVYKVREDHTLQNRQPQPPKSGAGKKPPLDQLQQQLVTKDNEVSSLREKILVVNELLSVEKRHIESLETQLIQKERELNSLRDQGESASKASRESDITRNDSQQARRKSDDFERQLLADNLENAKQRVGELILQLYAKENELTALRSSTYENSKQLNADLDLQTEELHQAKRRITEIEQQLSRGNTQELAQAKRRITELEQLTTGKEQELAQTKRRVVEIEQQTAGKEQELAQAKRRVTELEQLTAQGNTQELAQANRRITELEQRAWMKEHDLAQAKRRVTELEQQPTRGTIQELAQAKRRITEIEQQTAGKEQDLVQTKRRITEFEQQAVGKEQELAKAKHRVVELEQQTTGGKSQDLAQAKHRITELEQQTWLKEHDLAQAKRRVADLEQQATRGKSQELAQAKHRIIELERQTVGKEQDLVQAKRRLTELEQQTAGKEQELTQAKRRMTEFEQQATGGTAQDLAQARRRVTELEQQTTGKDQELAKLKDDLLHVSRKFEVLNPQLIARTTELEQTKQLLADLQRNAFPLVDPGTVQEPTLANTDPTNQRLVEMDLPLPNLDHPSSTGADDAEAGQSNLSKETESLARLLQAELAKGSVAMRRRGNKLTLAFVAGELFSPGEAIMIPGGISLLERVGSTLSDFHSQSIEVAVLPDNQPTLNAPRKTLRDNTELAQLRAERTSRALHNGGVDLDQIKTVGLTANAPTATNDTDNGQSKNHKVEIVILSDSEPTAHSSAKPSRLNKKPKMRSTETIVNR
jgi:outer membrane protein OmpA-like peptidoglycan-associated protein